MGLSLSILSQRNRVGRTEKSATNAPRRFFRAHAFHLATEFDDQAVIDDAIDRSRGGQGNLEDLISFREYQLGGDNSAALLTTSERFIVKHAGWHLCAVKPTDL
ncbi:MAG: hypothetical protein ACP5HM_14850 [Anaerolineae bacterium]